MRISESLTALLATLSTAYALQASQIPPDTPLSELVSSAKAHLAQDAPQDALVYFDVAISRDPTNYITIFQRGAAYLSMGKSFRASDDFDRVLELKPDFEAALLQRSRLKARAAHWDEALRDLERAGKNPSVEYQELEIARDAAALALDAEKQGNWEECVSQAGVAIMKANTALSLRQARAHCRLERGEVEEGISDLAHVLQIAPGMVEPHLQMSAMLFYALGDNERGLAQIRRCLHSDPDSKPCNRLYRRERQLLKRLEKLRGALEARKFNNAVNLLVSKGEEDGLIADVKVDVQEAKSLGHIYHTAPNHLYNLLVEKTCEAYHEMRMMKKAGPYCADTLQLIPHSLPGLLYQAQVALDQDQFEDAVRSLNTANEHHPGSQEVQSLLQKANVLLKRSKQKDYYKTLGVSRDADDRTIKRAYRQLTKQHHPDKTAAQGVSKEEAEKKMASINEAYEVLSTPELRAQFDNGHDPNDPGSQGGHPFQGNPFGGGQQFFFQQSGGGFPFAGGFPFR
ncbi:hypothetical protein NUU61_000352 [Penicillium alfredii]|uniref:Tetratricopeptide repeat and J domain-containing co-chaperone DNJ1 n=1 Tax=Penicillium alfredii TaxID=1506179 RepID=A0A9W9G9J7_9EURO|nr:uncharacterized protein NUU61_000352 [Penicillium alfredii]KAJ5114593.1 hypothetical protein NUU61_000352 [Penicillium alfredii]